MSLNFPSSPTVGQVFIAEGVSFTWTGAVWVQTGGASASDGIPIGAVMFFAANSVPPGWLVCANQPVTAIYPDLRQYLLNAGSPYGELSGDPRVPDLRGEFIRGFDDGRGVDAGRVFGSAQADDFKSHTHGALGGGSLARLTSGGTGGTFGFNAGTSGAAAATTAAEGGTETRPRNVALLPCIKAFAATVVEGIANFALATPAQARAGTSPDTLMTPALVQARQGVQALTMAGQTNVVFDQVPLETSELLLTFSGINLPANSFLTFDWFDQPLARAFSGRAYAVNGAVSSVGGEDNHGNFALENNTVAGFPTGIVRLLWDEQGSWIVSGTLRRSPTVQAFYSGSYNGAGGVKPRQLRLNSALAVLSGTPGNVALRWRI